MELRDYQIDCLSKLREAIQRGETKLLVKAPCSFGKTIVFCEIAKRAMDRSNKTLIIVDNVALVEQTYKKMLMVTEQENVGIFCASLGKKEDSKLITISTIQSIIKSAGRYKIVIVDEVDSGLSRTVRFLNSSASIIIGFTATPFSAKGRAIYGYDLFFPRLTYSMPVRELLKRKIITPMVYGAERDETKMDFSNVKTYLGDYAESDLQKLYEIEVEKVDAQLRDMVARTTDRKKIIIMCTGIKHANYVAKSLENAVAYHSQVDNETRAKMLDDFEFGNTRYLVGVMAIYKGLDITCVDCLVNMRPTKSYPFYIQFAGRGVRNHLLKLDCLFLDYGQTVEQLGFYEDFVEIDKKARSVVRPPEMYPKKCPECLTLLHPAKKLCACGHVFEKPTTINLTEEAYSAPEKLDGLVLECTSHETYGVFETFSAIVAKFSDNREVAFVYPKKFEWAMRNYERHKANIRKGSWVQWKKSKSGLNTYYNIVSIQ